MIDFLLITTVALLCVTGVLLSALAFSGTWLVLLAALIAYFYQSAPSIGMLVLFLIICIGAEVIESIAGFVGVQKQGGSKLAGFASVVGGLLGAAIGSALLPVIGTIAGMLLGSFGLAFFIEWKRLNHHEQAAKIAWGAVLARLFILFFKTALTLGMSISLLYTLIK